MTIRRCRLWFALLGGLGVAAIVAAVNHAWTDWVPDSITRQLPNATKDEVLGLLGDPTVQGNGGGQWVSELFPTLGEMVDELAFIRSVTSKFSEHTSANYFLHTGTGLQGRPSAGAWLHYGLGSANQNLPGFVVLNGGLTPAGGVDNFGAGFLPATYQGSVFKSGDVPLANIKATEPANEQRAKLDLIGDLDRQRAGGHDAIE